jgi:hypothetical protein
MNKTKVATLPTLIQHCLEFLARAIRKEEIRVILIGKEVIRLSLFTDYMILKN